MGSNYKNLKDLKAHKALLKDEIRDLEDIITFKDKKESLGVMTHGFTDPFLKENINSEGETTLSLDTQNIMSAISSGIKESASKKNIAGLAKNSVSSGLLETTVKMGLISLVGNFAKKSVMNKNWKRKLLGLALIYIVPYLLKFIRKKLDNYQKSKTTASLQKLI